MGGGGENKLPISVVHTVVIVDAMSMIRRLSFKKDDSFVDISNRFRQYRISNITQGTQSIHFHCDRYLKTSMKADKRHNRSGKLRSAKVYKVDRCTDEIRVPTLSRIRIYMGRGFKEEF